MIAKIKKCRKCELYKNQDPLIDQCYYKSIMVVGLSAKKIKEKDNIPLDKNTRSGKLIYEMECISKKYGYEIYRTNLVKCVPLDSMGKLRYPTTGEINQCVENIMIEINEIKPIAIILLGKQVQSTFESLYNVSFDGISGCSFEMVEVDTTRLIPVYHPSYVLRSLDRKNEYIKNFKKFINTIDC